MNENFSMNDQATLAEALRRMNSGKPGIPSEKVRAFLNTLQAEWDQGRELTEAQIRERFQRFVAEASHVPS